MSAEVASTRRRSHVRTVLLSGGVPSRAHVSQSSSHIMDAEIRSDVAGATDGEVRRVSTVRPTVKL